VKSTTSLVGNTVTYSSAIQNTGTVDALNLVYTQLLPTGMTFIPGTLTVDGISFPVDDPTVGAPVAATLTVGQTIIVAFQATITGYPSGGVFISDADVSFSFSPDGGMTIIPLGNEATNTTQVTVPVSTPSTLKKCVFLDKTRYSLTARWLPVTGAVTYNIYNAGKLVAQVSATDPLVYETCLKSKSEAYRFTVSSVDASGVESAAIPLSVSGG
jgi:uncharacterized repeat protein (TIGR01451 family)